MRPGQLQPNEFEAAILERIGADNPAFKLDISRLHVLRRTFTGVGSFTEFLTKGEGNPRDIRTFSKITLPALSEGLGNVASLQGDELQMLELYTYGDEKWDGLYDGFVITPRV